MLKAFAATRIDENIFDGIQSEMCQWQKDLVKDPH